MHHGKSVTSVIFVNMNRSSYKSKFFLLPVMAFSVLYTLPKFFELRLKWDCGCGGGNNSTLEEDDYENESE